MIANISLSLTNAWRSACNSWAWLTFWNPGEAIVSKCKHPVNPTFHNFKACQACQIHCPCSAQKCLVQGQIWTDVDLSHQRLFLDHQCRFRCIKLDLLFRFVPHKFLLPGQTLSRADVRNLISLNHVCTQIIKTMRRLSRTKSKPRSCSFCLASLASLSGGAIRFG